MSSILDVDDVVSHDELDEFLGGALSTQQALLPPKWAGQSEPARQRALDDVLRELNRRTPPIAEADITDSSELAQAVLYRAAEHIYRLNITTSEEGAAHHAQAKDYGRMYREEMQSMEITVTGGAEIPAGGSTFTVFRR